VDSATGRPIADAELVLDQLGAGAAGRQRVKTDSKGAFSLSNLPVGRYDLLAGHPDYRDQSHGLPPESPMRGAVQKITRRRQSHGIRAITLGLN
jgi:hypothetical protein